MGQRHGATHGGSRDGPRIGGLVSWRKAEGATRPVRGRVAGSPGLDQKGTWPDPRPNPPSAFSFSRLARSLQPQSGEVGQCGDDGEAHQDRKGGEDKEASHGREQARCGTFACGHADILAVRPRRMKAVIEQTCQRGDRGAATASDGSCIRQRSEPKVFPRHLRRDTGCDEHGSMEPGLGRNRPPKVKRSRHFLAGVMGPDHLGCDIL